MSYANHNQKHISPRRCIKWRFIVHTWHDNQPFWIEGNESFWLFSHLNCKSVSSLHWMNGIDVYLGWKCKRLLAIRVKSINGKHLKRFFIMVLICHDFITQNVLKSCKVHRFKCINRTMITSLTVTGLININHMKAKKQLILLTLLKLCEIPSKNPIRTKHSLEKNALKSNEANTIIDCFGWFLLTYISILVWRSI